jgi:uncharacterized BrkB/YihY/UPF0761 family membrane protein
MADPPDGADQASENADDGLIDLGPAGGARAGSSPTGDPATGDPIVTGRLRSAGVRAKKTREEAERRVQELRERSELVDAALEAGDLDRQRAGSLLAGGIAFRVFIWLLPAALFAAAVTGLFRLSGSAQPDRVARTLGLGASVAAIVRQATRESHRGTVALLAIGLVLMLYASMSLVRALRVANVLAWEEPFGRRPHLLRDGAILSGLLLTMLSVETGVTYVRNRVGLGSLLLSLVPVAIGGSLWLALSLLLPHGNAPWRALLPGALLFGLGTALLHFASLYYFAPRLARAPALYGSLGTAATLLVWLFLLSRIAVASAFLNASLWRRRPGN